MSRPVALRTMRATSMIAAVFSVLRAEPARAEAETHPTAQLEYTVNADASGVCPDESAFRARVGVRLGYDPFVTVSTDRVRVRIERAGPRIEATVMFDSADPAPGSRHLDGLADRCDILADSVAAAVALAIDPVGQTAVPSLSLPTPPALPPLPAPAPSSASLLSTQTTDLPPAKAAQATNPPSSTHLVAALYGVASIGVMPNIGFGGGVSIGARRGAFGISAEARLESTAEDAAVTVRDRVNAASYSGGIVPCVYSGAVVACLGWRAGALSATALDVATPMLTNAFASDVFARALVALPLGHGFELTAGVEGALPIVRTSFVIDSRPVWTSSVAAGSLLLGVTSTLL